MNRRRALATSLAFAAASGRAQAPDWPRGPLKIVLPFPPGGLDVLARLIADRLSQRLGQPVVLDHRPGAAGNIAMESVARGPADGYTWLMTNAILAVNPALFKLRYNPLTDLQPVVPVARMPFLVFARRELPADDPEGLTRLIRQAPGGLSCGNAGGGTRLACELLGQQAGARLLSVPFKGLVPALTELAAGRLDLVVAPSQVGRALVQDGHIKVLARSTTAESAGAPGPTGLAPMPGLTIDTWYALFAPSGTAAPVVDRVNREVNALLAEADTHRRAEALDLQVTGGTAESLGRLLRADIERYRRIATQAGLQPE